SLSLAFPLSVGLTIVCPVVPNFLDLFPCLFCCPNPQPFKLCHCFSLFFRRKEQEQDQYRLWIIPAVQVFMEEGKMMQIFAFHSLSSVLVKPSNLLQVFCLKAIFPTNQRQRVGEAGVRTLSARRP